MINRSCAGLLLTCCVMAMEVSEPSIIPMEVAEYLTPQIELLLVSCLEKKLDWICKQGFRKNNGVMRAYKKALNRIEKHGYKKFLEHFSWKKYSSIKTHLEKDKSYQRFKEDALETSFQLKKNYSERLRMLTKKQWDIFYENALYLMEDFVVGRSKLLYPNHFLHSGKEKDIDLFAEQFLNLNMNLDPDGNDGEWLISIMLICCYIEYLQDENS